MSESVLIENRTTMGHTVLMFVHEVTTNFGAHGVKIGPAGELELLLLEPEGSGWVPIEEAPMVQAGTTRSKARKS